MKTIMMCVVMMLAAAAHGQADNTKVDPAKLDREKRRAEQALTVAQAENKALVKEIARLKSELEKRNEDAIALRDALLKKMNADEFMAKLSDIDLAKLVMADPKIVEATKREDAIQKAIKEYRLEVGMTVDQADKALRTPHTTAAQDASSITYQWKVYNERGRAKEPYLSAIYQARFVNGRLVTFRKVD